MHRVYATVKMLAAVLILVVAVLYVAFSYISNYEYKKKISKVKSVPALPLFGHVFRFGRNNTDFLTSITKMWEKLGRDKFILKIGIMDVVIITKPKDVEIILSSNHLVQKNVIYKTLKQLFGDGILTAKPVKWRALRKALSPAFNFKLLETYVNAFRGDGDQLVHHLSTIHNEDVDIYKVFYKQILISLCKAGIGLNMGSMENFDKYVENSMKLVAMANDRMISSWKAINFIYNLTAEGKSFRKSIKWLHNIHHEILKNKEIELRDLIHDVNSGKETLESITMEKIYYDRKLTFIEILLLGRKENGEPLTATEIVDEIQLFTLAGHETSSTAISFTLYNLANNPDIQEAVYQEQLQLAQGDFKNPITFQDLQGMPYLDCVIKESMRMYPPVIYFGRQLTDDTTLSDGTVLPNGINVLFMPFLSHRDPEIFPEPERFNVNRFLNNAPNRFSYFPFSTGPRDCIGKKLAGLLVRYWLATVVRSLIVMPGEGPAPKLIAALVLKSSTGINLRFQNRN